MAANQKYKRVLVLSHNAFSKVQNNGKTLESFFKRWDKKCIAQLYLQPDLPDHDFCNNYFRMTDYEVLNNVFFNGKVGHRIFASEKDSDFIDHMNPMIKKLYFDRRKSGERKGLNNFIHKLFVARIPLFVGLRELLWARSKWKSNLLIEWIKEFSPDVLFFQGSNGVFGYEIALWICNEFKIPLILELTDDYTTSLYSCSLLERINKKKYREVFAHAISLAYRVITISEYMAIEYKKRFGGEYSVLMNSVNINATDDEPDIQDHVRFLYAGNVSINRWRVLVQIGKAINEINDEHDIKCKLDIYTPTLMQEKIRRRLSSVESIECKGSLNQEELAVEIQRSNILVHVEAFDKKNKKITRLSISTKIPEYMASKRCILAVGPNDVASIIYLRDNCYAQVAESDNINIIKDSIIELINRPDVRKTYSEAAYKAAYLRHHPDTSQKIILEIVEDACR